MSRTYRLRHVKSGCARKFIDGSATVHQATVDEQLSYNVVHAIFGLPCKYIGKPVVEYRQKRDYWEHDETLQVDHAICMRDAFEVKRSWYWKANTSMAHMVDMIATVPRYAVAPAVNNGVFYISKRKDAHSVARRRGQFKGRRAAFNVWTRRIVITGEHDADEGARCFLKEQRAMR